MALIQQLRIFYNFHLKSRKNYITLAFEKLFQRHSDWQFFPFPLTFLLLDVFMSETGIFAVAGGETSAMGSSTVSRMTSIAASSCTVGAADFS